MTVNNSLENLRETWPELTKFFFELTEGQERKKGEKRVQLFLQRLEKVQQVLLSRLGLD